MTKSRLTTAETDAILGMLRDAAQAGEPCPSNKAIVARVGWQSTSSAADALRILEEAGQIVVHRGNMARVVEAADGSWRTAGEIGTPHPHAGRTLRKAPPKPKPASQVKPEKPAPSRPLLTRREDRAATVAAVEARERHAGGEEAARLARERQYRSQSIAAQASVRAGYLNGGPLHYPADLPCQWPSGAKERGGVRFECTSERVAAKPYCAAHCAVSYEARKERAA